MTRRFSRGSSESRVVPRGRFDSANLIPSTIPPWIGVLSNCGPARPGGRPTRAAVCVSGRDLLERRKTLAAGSCPYPLAGSFQVSVPCFPARCGKRLHRDRYFDSISAMQRFDRRRFLQGAAALAAIGGGAAERGVSIVYAREDRAPAGTWAVGELKDAFAVRQIPARVCDTVQEAGAADLCILAAPGRSAAAKAILREAGTTLPEGPETVAIANGKLESRSVLLASGGDARGFPYATLELADRVRHAADPFAALAFSKPVVERPANTVRAVSRLFTSDVEDKPWFNDREMWPRYFAMLATQRFNRFHLALGIGYDFLRNVTDAYFLFSYPFLLAVPGYNVRVPELPDAERDRNLQMLRLDRKSTRLYSSYRT